jgi:hypothetical protein
VLKTIESFPGLLAQFDQAIAACGLGAVRDLLLPLTHLCYRIHPRTPVGSDTATSHLAGLPNLPDGFSWPREDNADQTFLAQIHLNELPEPRIGALPKKGTLWVFLGADETAYDIAHRIVFSEHPRANFHPTPPPGETVFADERQFSCLNLGLELTLSLDETYTIEALDPYDAEIEALSVKIG